MKLSDIQGERTLDVIADIIPAIANIAKDADAVALFKREAVPEGMTAKSFLGARVTMLAPKLIKTHKADLIAIFAAIEGVTQEEYSKTLNVGKLVKDVIELLADKAFFEFFTFAQSGVGNVTSGSAQEVTEEAKA